MDAKIFGSGDGLRVSEYNELAGTGLSLGDGRLTSTSCVSATFPGLTLCQAA